MAVCCDDKSCEITTLKEKHARVLKIALAINLAMFFVEAIAGWLAHSNALMADALDMLGDATVYGMSLFVITKSLKAQAQVSLVKAALMMSLGLFVLGDAIHKIFIDSIPDAPTMGMVAILALIANLVCFLLLYTHREDGINMTSTWLCSRNDLIANVSVIGAAGICYITTSKWPDILIGVAIAGLFLRSAIHIANDALNQIKRPPRRSIPLKVNVVSKKQ